MWWAHFVVGIGELSKRVEQPIRREEAGDREEEKMVYVLLYWCILFNEFCNKDFPF